MADTPHATTPLHDRHQRLGAQFGEFGGWQMPLQYTGVLAEHAAVREGVGIFDVSHLGKLAVRGAGAREFVDACLTNDVGRLKPGQAQYSLCCNETGGVVDDVIIYLRGDDDVFLMPNAANNAEVAGRLAAAAPDGLQVRDEHRSWAVLAVQGPLSPALMDALGLPTDHRYMSFVDADLAGVPVTVCRSGYTGERGYELLVPWNAAGAVWDAVLAAGAAAGIVPCGLAARDTLRTEMGYPLHGQDLSPGISAVEAGLSWVVAWDKPRFWGRAALRAERDRGPARRLRGLRAAGRGIPRPGMAVRVSGAGEVGVVTSGTFSPTLRCGIGLALLAADVDVGASVTVDVRGRDESFTVVRPPFVDRPGPAH